MGAGVNSIPNTPSQKGKPSVIQVTQFEQYCEHAEGTRIWLQ